MTGPTLDLFTLFHLNLAFSSIEEESRAAVIERAYWPALAFADAHGPIGIEATGYTLEEIAAREPAWIDRLGELIAEGKVELVGSGYAQLIGPLIPAKAVAANLRLGNETYRSLLGTQPKIALVNEQAYSAGLVGHYLDAGYEALLMDWDNPASHHPEWPAEIRYQPQRAMGADGRSIGLLWTNTVAFQKLQLYAHGDIALDDYLDFVATRRGEQPRVVCLYASDGEIFDFRPGRYRTEEVIGEGEWNRVGAAFFALSSTPAMPLTTPARALTPNTNVAAAPLRLETASHPVPVKKQRKYNLTRWAVSGRDDIGINAACQRIYAALLRNEASESEWQTLCRLWASDFRTHITETRWRAYCTELAAMETRLRTAPAPAPRISRGRSLSERHIDIETPTLSAQLDRRRGLAIQRLAFAGDIACVGGLPHGYFDDIALQADWYTGDCVFEQPGEPKITDLDWAESEIAQDGDDILIAGRIATTLGTIGKHLRFHGRRPRVDFDLTFHWPEWGKGALRLGHITLLPQAFELEHLALATQNGGFAPEHFPLHGAIVDHGAPVSFLVSASCGIGMTEGLAGVYDRRGSVRGEGDRETAPLFGVLSHRRSGGSPFSQMVLS